MRPFYPVELAGCCANMYYRLLFLLSVGFGILYDWLSKYYLIVDSLLFLFVVHIVGLFILVNYTLLHSVVKEAKIPQKMNKIHYLTVCYTMIYLLPIHAVSRLLVGTVTGMSVLISNKKININYLAFIRSIISITGLCLIFECFGTSKLTQITSGYYAIPIGDFIFSSIMNDISGILVSVLAILLLVVILSKEMLVNWIGFYVVLGILSVFLLIFIFVLSGIKKTKLRKINILFIAVSIVILFVYNARPMAIVGSVLLSLADIFVQRFSDKDVKSENISFFIGCIICSLVSLLFRYDYSWWRWLLIGFDVFPIHISNEQWGWFMVVSMLTVGIQAILNICFHNKSLIKFIPLRYLDLCVANILEGEWLLSFISLALSGLFGYFL